MRCLQKRRKDLGFDLVDLMIVISIIFLVSVCLLPILKARHLYATRQRVSCASNLKQVGVAFRLYANDHDGHYPMTLENAIGGTKQFTAPRETYRHFLAVGTELSSPHVLVCPEDSHKIKVPDFNTNFTVFNNSNISYFIGLDADQTSANMLLTGDRNLTNTILPKGPIMTLNRQSQVGWTRDLHSAKSKEPCGNIGFADGSASQLTTLKLREALGKSTNGMQRIMLP